jgi:flagellar protein FliS
MDKYSSVNDYKKLEVTSTNRLKLILMVYDAAIASLKQAIDSHKRNDAIKRNRFISRAQLIISELNSALNMEQGKGISESLSKIYYFLNRHLNEVHTDNDIQKVKQSLNILNNLRDAWKEISVKTEPQKVNSEESRSGMSANEGGRNTFYG